MPDPSDPRPKGLITVKLVGYFRGFPAEIVKEIEFAKLDAAVRYLEQHGFCPPPQPLRFELTAEGLPICPRHNVPMRRREKQGDHWHSHCVKAADGSEYYCRGYPGPDSPGYWLELAAEEIPVPPGQPAGTVGHSLGSRPVPSYSPNGAPPRKGRH